MCTYRTHRGSSAPWTRQDASLCNAESIAMVTAERTDTGYLTVVEWAKARKPTPQMRHAALAAIGLGDAEGF